VALRRRLAGLAPRGLVTSLGFIISQGVVVYECPGVLIFEIVYRFTLWYCGSSANRICRGCDKSLIDYQTLAKFRLGDWSNRFNAHSGRISYRWICHP
jgi:hypothetical protein